MRKVNEDVKSGILMVKKLSKENYKRTFLLVPRVAVNLLIKNNKGKILLTKRAISPQKDYWHIPGSFLLKGEKISKGLERVAQKEIGIKINLEKLEFLGVFEDLKKDPRGHVIDIIYGYTYDGDIAKLTEESKAIKFFLKFPYKIGFNHKDYLINITKHWVG